MPNIKPLLVSAIVTATTVSSTHAEAILAIQKIASPDYIPINLPLIGTIDQTGLSANYVSGVTNFEAFVASTTHASGSVNTVFVNSNGQNQPNGIVNLFGTFALDLGSVQDVDGFAIWNSGNRPDMLLDFELYADTDGNFSNGGTTLLGSYALDPTVAGIALEFPETSARFFHIRLIDHDGTDFLLLGESAFRESSIASCTGDIASSDGSGGQLAGPDGIVDLNDVLFITANWDRASAAPPLLRRHRVLRWCRRPSCRRRWHR